MSSDPTGSAETVTEVQVEDFVAAALLSEGIKDPSELTSAGRALLERFAGRCGLSASATKEQSDRAIEAYFEAHPIPQSLRVEFVRGYRSSTPSGDTEALEEAAKRLGQDAPLARTKEVPKAEGPRGALGYFAAQKGSAPDTAAKGRTKMRRSALLNPRGR